MRRALVLFLILLILAGLAYWSPWISKDFAEKRVETAFTVSWQSVMDGCGINCKGCGAKASRKTGFGYTVQIEYACGLLPEDSPKYHQQSTGFVSFLGTVHGLPKP